jgi:nitrogen fixation protein FixH
MTAMARSKHVIKGWHVLATMIGFFVSVTAVDGVMIYDAVSTFGGDTRDAYRTGLAYNQRIAEQTSQDRLGWTEASAFDSATSEFRFTLTDREGRGIDGLQLTVSIGRPATDVFDREVVLQGVGNGTYSATIANLSEGTWSASVAASGREGGRNGLVYRSKVRIWKQP